MNLLVGWREIISTDQLQFLSHKIVHVTLYLLMSHALRKKELNERTGELACCGSSHLLKPSSPSVPLSCWNSKNKHMACQRCGRTSIQRLCCQKEEPVLDKKRQILNKDCQQKENKTDSWKCYKSAGQLQVLEYLVV